MCSTTVLFPFESMVLRDQNFTAQGPGVNRVRQANFDETVILHRVEGSNSIRAYSKQG